MLERWRINPALASVRPPMGKRKALKKAEKADIEVSKAAWGYKNSLPVRAMGVLGKMTDQPPLFAFAAGIAAAGLIRREPRLVSLAARAATAHWIGIQLKDLLKNTIVRTRPPAAVEYGHHEMKPGHNPAKKVSSFPSGHTAGAVAIARSVARSNPNAALPAYGLAAAAAISRVAECEHFVTDTAAGVLIGIAAEKAAAALFAGSDGRNSA
ncbi:phosphatase PAP2 family protein [Sphingomonas tabacisoli]|uniref:Phosphatase PAP2 family protein n=1 Tax=Sphingomonas tabacisoli TaxID=2249466 RepID=A0ABW4I1D8_9SPHN